MGMWLSLSVVTVVSTVYNIWHSFCSFSYSQTYQWESQLSIYDVIVDKKSYSREWQFSFIGGASKSGIFSLIFVLNSLWRHKESFLVGTWSTIGKQEKRLPDITVEATVTREPCVQIFFVNFILQACQNHSSSFGQPNPQSTAIETAQISLVHLLLHQNLN